MKKTLSGFTIVELLIVIVVIGILAAITSVVYAGIVQRATTATIENAADSWEKIVRLEKTSQGTLATTTDPICLGRSVDDFPATADFAKGQCDVYTDNEGYVEIASYDPTYFTNWKTTPLPNGLLPTTTYTSATIDGYTYQQKSRGIVFASPENTDIQLLWWIPQVSGKCGRGTHVGTDDAPGKLNGAYCELRINE